MGAPARAADPAEGVKPPSAVSEPKAAGDDAAADAFQRALAAYEAKDLAGALIAMRESYRLSGRTELLYNIARIEQELGTCTEALFDYQQYLKQVPDGQYRSDAERASRELSARCPPSQAAPAALPASPPVAPTIAAPEPPPPTPVSAAPNSGALQRGLGWTAVGVGVVATASALYFRQRAKDDKTSYERAVAIEEAGGPFSEPELASDQKRHENIALALAFGGGALVAGGIALLVLAPRGTSGSARTTVYLSPASLGLSVVRSF